MPTNDVIKSSSNLSNRLAKPKSAILNTELLATSILAGLRSRWIIPLLND